MTDAMLTVSGVGFALALLPALRDSLRDRTTMTLLTSVPTAVLLANTATALFILRQPMSASVTLVTASCWGFLALRRWWKRT